MAKQSDECKRLQRRLIPVNIVVSVISFVAAISLFFCPLLKIDMGKVTDSPIIKEYAREGVKRMTNKEANFSDILSSIDIGIVMNPIVDSTMDNIKGEFSITTNYLMELALSPTPADTVLDTILYDNSGILNQLSDSIAEGVNNALQSPEMVETLDVAVVDAVSTALKNNLPSEYSEKVNAEELNQTVKKLDEVKTEDEAVGIVNDYIQKLEENNGLQPMPDEDKENIESQVRDMYQETVEHTRDEQTGEDNFSLEAFLCVQISNILHDAGFDDGIDLGEIIGNLNSGGGGYESGDETASVCRFAAVADEPVEEVPDGEKPSGGEDVPSDTPNDGENEQKPAKIYTNYGELLDNVVIIPDNLGEQLATKITETLMDDINKAVETGNKYSFVFLAVFILFAFYTFVWLLLGVWSLLRIFLPNKRFSMWYVKLFGATPCILFGGLLLFAQYALPNISIIPASVLSTVNAVWVGLSTLTWISGICYLALWIVSIFWAHPIKRRIKTARY